MFGLDSIQHADLKMTSVLRRAILFLIAVLAIIAAYKIVTYTLHIENGFSASELGK